MKFYLVALLILVSSCQSFTHKNSFDRTIRLYIHALNTSDHKALSEIITDSITLKEQDLVICEGKQQFYTIFQWDSVFNPHYTLMKITHDDKCAIATIAKTCDRIQFLQDTAFVSNVMFELVEEKIEFINTTEYISYNDERWNKNRSNLINWIKKNHPELDGFLIDQTKAGAENYQKAIKLYQNR